jgi:hypothetical protein
MTTESLTVARPAPAWLKHALLAAFVFAACWAGLVLFWRTTDRTPANSELLLYLLGLPLLLVLASWGGRKLIASRKAAPAAAASTQAARAPDAPPEAPALAILAASLRSAHGASPEELSAAIADNKARADLDPELLDEDGFPAMTARCAYARDEALQEEITEWLAQNGLSELRLSDEQWRALTLGTAVVAELASRAASELSTSEPAPPVLQLAPVLPEEWQADQRRACGMWLKHTVAQCGWPPARIAMTLEAAPEAGRTTLSALLNRLAHEAASPDTPMAAIVVACASHIGEETVSRWAASGSLFTSAQPHGPIPGEGAAGLLLADLRQARTIEGGVFTLLGNREETLRDVSADEARRHDPKLLGELAERALKRHGADFSKVAAVIADTGHRSSRAQELGAHVCATMPELDGADDVVRVGLACGTCGDVPFITALALARHCALERDAAVLCISNEDPYRRTVALIQPPAP